MFKIENLTLREYLEKHNCQIVYKGIFFHYQGDVYLIGQVDNLDIFSVKLSELGMARGEIFIDTSLAGCPQQVKNKARYLKKVLIKFAPDKVFS